MKKLMITVGICVISLVKCVEYEEKITLRADGSGTMVIRYSLSETFSGKGEDGKDRDSPFITEKEEIAKALQSDNVNIDEIQTYTKEGKHYIETTLSFKDINDLPPTWIFENREMHFTEENGFLVFRSVLNFNEESEQTKEEDKMADLGESFVEALLSEYTFTFVLEMPSEITGVSPEGTIKNNTVTWQFPLSALVNKQHIELSARASLPSVALPSAGVIIILCIVLAGVIALGVIFKKKRSTA